jgi:hypothetical protein
MALTDFFRINLPYGLKVKANNEWVVFNREYLPLSWNSKDFQESIYSEDFYINLPLRTKYKGLTENAILKIIKNPNGIKRDDSGKISMIFFYHDRTNPQSNPKYWNSYFAITKAFSKFEKSGE